MSELLNNKANFENKLLQVLRIDKNNYFSGKGKINEPRVVAENVQELCKKEFVSCYKPLILSDHSDNLTRRSMGDIYIIDSNGISYYIDVKTHNKSTKFNMPNLTSIDRLSQYYSNLKIDKYFLILLVEYTVSKNNVKFESVKLFPIEHLSWDCLRIGNLGWGQVQISSANNIIINSTQTRKQWMIQFYKHIQDHYKKILKKSKDRSKIMKDRSNIWTNDKNP